MTFTIFCKLLMINQIYSSVELHESHIQDDLLQAFTPDSWPGARRARLLGLNQLMYASSE
jgi:hypothetical protein